MVLMHVRLVRMPKHQTMHLLPLATKLSCKLNFLAALTHIIFTGTNSTHTKQCFENIDPNYQPTDAESILKFQESGRNSNEQAHTNKNLICSKDKQSVRKTVQ